MGKSPKISHSFQYFKKLKEIERIMTVKINVSTAKGEIKISPEAGIHDAVEAITGALIAEGYAPDSIIRGYENMAKKLREAE